MDEHHRVKRDPPERTEPKRQWTDNFTTARESTQEGTGSADPRDAAYQTINDAYRLIDDYIRQGQQVAENFWMPLGASAAPFREAPERFMRALGDMTMAWVDVMQHWTSTNSGASPGAAGRAAPFPGVDSTAEKAANPSESASNQNQTTPLRVVVVAPVPIELVVDLNQRVDVSTLTLTELRDPINATAPLTDVSVQKDEHGVASVRVVVPEGHPSGTYSGLFLEQTTRRPRGTLSVTLLSVR